MPWPLGGCVALPAWLRVIACLCVREWLLFVVVLCVDLVSVAGCDYNSAELETSSQDRITLQIVSALYQVYTQDARVKAVGEER